MIILDTNVLSELVRQKPDPAVFLWVDKQPRARLYTTTIVQAEILSSISRLPDGKRRTVFSIDIQKMFAEEFAGRILPFDEQAAIHYAEITEKRRANGRPMEGFDGLIAAVARASKAGIATRNVRDFEGCDVDLINPWTADV